MAPNVGNVRYDGSELIEPVETFKPAIDDLFG